MLCFQEEIRQLAALVRTDELTRMFNFRYFNQALSLEVERTRRSGQPTCLIMLGLDHFKPSTTPMAMRLATSYLATYSV